jgi:hypothetical protein
MILILASLSLAYVVGKNALSEPDVTPEHNQIFEPKN